MLSFLCVLNIGGVFFAWTHYSHCLIGSVQSPAEEVFNYSLSSPQSVWLYMLQAKTSQLTSAAFYKGQFTVRLILTLDQQHPGNHQSLSNTMAASVGEPCETCSKPTYRVCTECDEGPGPDGRPMPTYYCSLECQQKIQTSHGAHCCLVDETSRLYRGADLVKEIYYACQQAMFDVDVTAIQKHNELIFLAVHPDKRKARDQFLLLDFPSHLVTDEEDKAAMLSYSSWGECAMQMEVLVTGFLEDMYVFPAQRATRLLTKEHRSFRYTFENPGAALAD